jgi:hypothetical protein
VFVIRAFDRFDWKHAVAMKVIANIPPDVLRDVVVEWLHLKDIARLDSAVCCHGARATFLQRLYGNRHRYYQYNRYSDGLEDWVTLKLPLECQVYFLRYAIKSLADEIRRAWRCGGRGGHVRWRSPQGLLMFRQCKGHVEWRVRLKES